MVLDNVMYTHTSKIMSHNEFKYDAIQAHQENKIVNDVKGPCWFLYAKPDIIRGQLDYMYQILLRIVMQLLKF